MVTPKSLSLRCEHFDEGSVEVEPVQLGKGGVHRLAVPRDEPATRPADNVSTASDIISYAVKKYTKLKAVGWRDVIKIHEEKKKTVNGKRSRPR
jgi:long-chain acyl-CoA synthetase